MSETSEEEDSSYKIFLNGIFMGLADIVPGVSGGTIALIVGIYEILMSAIKSVDLKFIPFAFLSLFDRDYFDKAKDDFLSIDYQFLLPLIFGIGSAIVGASFVIRPLLENYPAFIHSFFFGLILMSGKFVYDRIEQKSPKTFLAGVVGFIFAFLIVILQDLMGPPGMGINPSLPFLFISGFFAFCALILPGISGSFMLYLLGVYHYLIEVLHSIFDRWIEAGVFIIGGGTGVFLLSRVISYSLENYHSHTLFFLTGLMIGALAKPLIEISNAMEPSIEITTAAGAIIFGSIGVLIIFLLESNQN